MDCGTGLALLRVLRKSTTRGKRRDDESRTRTPALERGDSYHRPGVVVRAAAPQSKSRAVPVSRREGFSDGVSICGDGPRPVTRPARSNEEERTTGQEGRPSGEGEAQNGNISQLVSSIDTIIRCESRIFRLTQIFPFR